jgi:hypothetical protein
MGAVQKGFESVLQNQTDVADLDLQVSSCSQGGIMLRLFTASLLTFATALTAHAASVPTRDSVRAAAGISQALADDPTQKVVAIAVGFGFRYCGAQDPLPPMDMAFLCPGLMPTLQNYELALKPVKTAKPEWKMWEAPMSDTMVVNGVTLRYELVVAFAQVDGTNYVFVDGRITDDKQKIPAYFRITAIGDFMQLDATHHYSASIPVESVIDGKTYNLHLEGVVTVAKIVKSAGMPQPAPHN